MWEEGERRKLGKNVVVDDCAGNTPGIFMLDRSKIFRYDMTYNRWTKETCMPKKTSNDASVGFVALDGELHLLTLSNLNDSTGNRHPHQHKRPTTRLIQIYNPRRRT